MVLEKGHVGEHLALGRSELGEARSQPVGDGAPRLAHGSRAAVDTFGKRASGGVALLRPAYMQRRRSTSSTSPERQLETTDGAFPSHRAAHATPVVTIPAAVES